MPKKKKRHFLLNQIVLTKKESQKPKEQPVPAENQHCQADGSASHLNALNLVQVKSSSCVSAGGRSLCDGSGPAILPVPLCPALRSVMTSGNVQLTGGIFPWQPAGQLPTATARSYTCKHFTCSWKTSDPVLTGQDCFPRLTSLWRLPWTFQSGSPMDAQASSLCVLPVAYHTCC